MKKLVSLRRHLANSVAALKDNPDRLLAFIEQGEAHHAPRLPSLSFEYRYTATLVVTDFTGSADALIIPVLAWLQAHQPDRADSQALTFMAEVLDNESVDIEIKVALTEAVTVLPGDAGTVTAAHNAEPVFPAGFGAEPDPLREWEMTNG